MVSTALEGIDEQHTADSEIGLPAHRVSAMALLPGLAELWRETQGDPEIRIAILDGPVDLTHPCFRGAELERRPTVVPENGRSDHGTHVTSLIFGQPGSLIRGVAPRCTGLILPVFQQAEDAQLRACSQQDLARNISLALEAGAHIINVSGGELSSTGRGIDFLENAVRQAAERNVLIIAATGNDGCECLHVPAALPNVLPVGALDHEGHPLGSSNWSEHLEGLMAPGAMIEGALSGGRIGWMTGTSFATPLVTGIAALLLSLQKQRGQAADPAAVRRALLAGAQACDPQRATDCRRWLRGVVDPASARSALDADLVTGVSPSGALAPPIRLRLSKGETMSDRIEPTIATPEAPVEPVVEGVTASVCGSSLDDALARPSAAAEVEPAGDPVTSLVVVEPAGVEPSETRTRAIATTPVAGSPNDAASGHGTGVLQASTAPTPFPAGVQPSCQAMSMFSPFPPGQKAFTIGKLYYDFGTEARRDYFIAQVRSQYAEQGIEEQFNQGLIYNPEVMIKYLFGYDQSKPLPKQLVSDPKKNNLDAANALIWTVFIDQDPVYALVPEDQFAVVSFTRLAGFLADQGSSRDPKTFRVAMAGTINGSVTLFNGTVVPQLSTITRGMFDWDIGALVQATSPPDPALPVVSHGEDKPEAPNDPKPDPSPTGDPGGSHKGVDQDLRDFLLRVYDSLRNLGVTSEDRAKNFAATNAYQARQAFVWANSDGRKFKLDSIRATRSPICRRNSDCWDISLVFFDPQHLFQTARQVFEYTIDVSDVIPVQVGEARQFPVYGGPNP